MTDRKSLLEPYAKEQNLAQLSLFYFGKGRPKQTITAWEDDDKEVVLKCDCDYGVPGSFEQDCYTATMRIWIKKGKPETLEFSYSDIARELKLEPPRAWVGRIKKALKRLGHARYELRNCFVEAGKKGRVDTHFSLYDQASLWQYDLRREGRKSKKKSKSKVSFPPAIQKNLDAEYYQLLDMTWYRALPEGLPRRLYEYLEKKRHQAKNKVFVISEEIVCRWLPITDKNVTYRRKRLEKIAKALIEKGFLTKYRFDREKKLCVFTYTKKKRYAPPLKIKQLDFLDIESEKFEFKKSYTLSNEQKPIKNELDRLEQPEREINPPGSQNDPFLEVLEWIDSIKYFHQKRKNEISALNKDDVVKRYPGIKSEYERLAEEGKKPNPGWIYKAFMEGWSFAPKHVKEMQNESPEEKKQRILNEAWENLTEKEKEQLELEYDESIIAMEKLNGAVITENFREDFWNSHFLPKALARMSLIPGENQPAEKAIVEETKEQDASDEFLQAVSEISTNKKYKFWEMAKILSPENARPFQLKLAFVGLVIDYFKKEGLSFEIDKMTVARKVERLS